MKRCAAALRPIATAAVLTAAVLFPSGGRAAGTSDGAAFDDAQPPPGRILLGVLRADGILLPFASYDGDDWKRSWPDDLTSVDLPATLDAIPRGWWGGARSDDWRLWLPGSAEPSPFKIAAPITLMVGRSRRIGLRTDVKPLALPAAPFQVPFPKAGLAVAGDVRVESIASVSRRAPASAELLSAVGPDLSAAEERTVNGLRNNAGWKHPFDKVARARIEPELEAWYTSPLATAAVSVSYIEAVKKYPPRPSDEGCGLETVITGWVHHRKAGERPRTELKAVATYCDRERTSYMLPFGRIEAGGRTYWVFQMSGPDHEWYAVAEVMPTRVRYVAEFHGGGFLR
jgi:hypothetical protein